MHKVMVAVAVLGLAAGQAQAYQLTITGHTGNDVVQLYDNAWMSTQVIACSLQANLDGVPLGDIYCIDIHNYTETTYEVAAYSTTDVPSDRLDFDKANIGKVAYLVNTYSSDAHADAVKSAALQLAIWEAAYEDSFSTYGYDLGDGDFQAQYVDAAVLAQANSYLTNMGTGEAVVYDWIYDGQDLIAIQGSPIPEATTICFLGLALLPVLRRLRKK